MAKLARLSAQIKAAGLATRTTIRDRTRSVRLDESTVLPTVRDILGRSPRTFEQWAIAHAEELGKVTVG